VWAGIAAAYLFIAANAFDLSSKQSAFLGRWSSQPLVTQICQQYYPTRRRLGPFSAQHRASQHHGGQSLNPTGLVGVELVFYLLCPILLRLRWQWIGLLAALALVARIVAYAYAFERAALARSLRWL